MHEVLTARHDGAVDLLAAHSRDEGYVLAAMHHADTDAQWDALEAAAVGALAQVGSTDALLAVRGVALLRRGEREAALLTLEDPEAQATAQGQDGPLSWLLASALHSGLEWDRLQGLLRDLQVPDENL